MKKISAVIVAHNEERKIEDCLKSLNFADEIVVVLDKCTDKTKEIVKNYTNKIIEGSWHIEGQRRNIALENATGDWIFEIDADERVSSELAKEILAIRESEPCQFCVEIDNYVGGRLVKYGWIRSMGVSHRITMFNKGAKKYHEDKEIHPTADMKGEVKYLKNPLTHMMDEDISALIKRFDRNTTWRANDMISQNKKLEIGFFKEIFSIKMRLSKAFWLNKGYKEGILGLFIAILAAFYPTISRLKALEIKQSKK